MAHTRRSFMSLPAIAILVLALLVSCGDRSGSLVGPTPTSSQSTSIATPTESLSPSPSPSPSADPSTLPLSERYEDKVIGFHFDYPLGWHVEASKEHWPSGGGASLVNYTSDGGDPALAGDETRIKFHWTPVEDLRALSSDERLRSSTTVDAHPARFVVYDANDPEIKEYEGYTSLIILRFNGATWGYSLSLHTPDPTPEDKIDLFWRVAKSLEVAD